MPLFLSHKPCPARLFALFALRPLPGFSQDFERRRPERSVRKEISLCVCVCVGARCSFVEASRVQGATCSRWSEAKDSNPFTLNFLKPKYAESTQSIDPPAFGRAYRLGPQAKKKHIT